MPAWKRLISRTLSSHEVIPLIEATLTSEDAPTVIRDLRGDDAQNFVDAIQEVRSIPLFTACDLINPRPLRILHFRTLTSVNQALDLPDLTPQLRVVCRDALRKICGRQVLLPRSLQIPFCYDRSGVAWDRGRHADVWKGEYRECPVAVKVMRPCWTGNLHKIIRVSHHPKLTKSAHRRADRDGVEVLRGSCGVGNSSPPERFASVGSDNG